MQDNHQIENTCSKQINSIKQGNQKQQKNTPQGLEQNYQENIQQNQKQTQNLLLDHFDANKQNRICNEINNFDNKDKTIRKKQMNKKKIEYLEFKFTYDSQQQDLNLQNNSTYNSNSEQNRSKSELYDLNINGQQEYISQKIEQMDEYLLGQLEVQPQNIFQNQFCNKDEYQVDYQNDQTIKTKEYKKIQKLLKTKEIDHHKYQQSRLQEKQTNLIYQDFKELVELISSKYEDSNTQNNNQQNHEIMINNIILKVKNELIFKNLKVKESIQTLGCGFVLQATQDLVQHKKQNYLILIRIITDQNINKEIKMKLEFLYHLYQNTTYTETQNFFQISQNETIPEILAIVLEEQLHTYNFLHNIEKILAFFKESEYFLGNFIAEGGFGVVFDGMIYQNKELQNVIFKIQFTNDESQKEIEQEYLIMKGFEKNVNLIQVIDYKVIDKYVCVIVMEKCECNLRDRMEQFNQKNEFSFMQLLQIIFDLIDGLILLKTYKIVHLDIKPQNILVNKYGIYIVSDFGTSFKANRNQIFKVKGYTPSYAAQEVIDQNGIANYKSDIFSFGKTLLNVLSLFEKCNIEEKIELEKFRRIVNDYVVKEESSERKNCLEIHKLFYEIIEFEKNQEFLMTYIDKIRLILSQIGHDSNKDIQFFNEISVYYNLILLDLKQKVKKSYVLRNINDIDDQNQLKGQTSHLRKEVLDKIIQEEDSECIFIYNYIANSYNEQSKFQISQEYYLKALNLSKQLYKNAHIFTASTLNKLGLINLKDVGLQYSLQAVQMIGDIFIGDNDLKAIYLNTLSWCYSSLQNPEKALQIQELSLRMRCKIFKLYHARIAVGLNNFGTMCLNFDVKKSLKYQILSLKIRQYLYKENHPCVARSLDCVGQCYLSMGNLEYAKKYIYASYQMRKSIYEGNIDCIAISLNNIAQYHKKAGQFMKSIFFYKLYYQMMQHLYQDVGYIYIFIFNTAQCLFFNRQFQSSICFLQYCLKTFQRAQFQIAKQHIIIGLCYFNMNQFQKGLESFCSSIIAEKNIIRIDIHKLNFMVKSILFRYKLFGYIQIFKTFDQGCSNKHYHLFLKMVYLIILEVKSMNQSQQFQMYLKLFELNRK